jgi:hypothetical protein
VKKLLKTSFETAPAGNHVARITAVADLGMQRTTFGGTERTGGKLGITFELAHEKSKDGKPFAVFDIVSLSLNEKSRLFEIAQAALARAADALDPAELLGKTVMVSVVHRAGPDNRLWANVDQVTPVPRGLAVPPTKSPLLLFDLEQPDPAANQKLPALFRKKMEGRIRDEKRAESADPALSEDVAF